MKRKGIILAGGKGTRLYPVTKVVSKQLLPIFGKPMIYYPLSTLMRAKVREILLISTESHLPLFKHLLGDGSQWGLTIDYAMQPFPDGLAQALIIGEQFLNGSPSVLILGDNLLYGSSLYENMTAASAQKTGATVFSYYVKDPERYGVVEFNKDGKVLSLVEKPTSPRSNYAIIGLYYFDEHAPSYANQLKPSHRGELEIVDLNNIYLEKKQLSVQSVSRDVIWLDTGTHESLLEANQLVEAIEHRQGVNIGCPEEIAYHNGWIDEDALLAVAQQMPKSQYREYINKILKLSKHESH